MNRKGISPLIAAVLLIAFTMAVAAILTAWVTTFTKQTTGQVGNKSQRLVACSFAGLSIYDAVYNQGNNAVTIAVANTGTRDLSDGVSIVVSHNNGSAITHVMKGLDTGSVQSVSLDMWGGVSSASQLSTVRAASIGCPSTKDQQSTFTTVQ
ncbi:MAG: archaellin/type IV pilin N-terminal domain-containing protein [Candidatus Nanohaloarchaea archaeon]|nr:archaellin/type IV pilin N-terminal domain-containing protein [Candidatus Nanohaloarchaea archaeon]